MRRGGLVRRLGGWVVAAACAAGSAGFSLDRPRHVDLSGLGWSAAFSGACAVLAREYPFTAWKGLDWRSEEAALAPEVAAAEARQDRRAYYRALRRLVWWMRDGHARVLGDDGGLRREETGGSFGLTLVVLDDGRLIAARVAAGGPAERAGVRAGAEIETWNGRPPGEALAAAPVLWSERPPATREGLLLTEAQMLDRAPLGAAAILACRNRGEAAATPRTLLAAPAPPEAPACLRASVLLFGRTFERRELPAGIGYVQLRFELPTLLTLFPGWELRRALARFAADRLPGVVLDVRGNCGGADLFVPPLVAPFLRERLFYEIPGILRAGGATGPGSAQGEQEDGGGGEGGGGGGGAGAPAGAGRPAGAGGGGAAFLPDRRQAVEVRPRPPIYTGRVAVLVDGDTVSAGEAVPYLLKGQPETAVIGWHATQGSFGIGEKSIALPAGFELVYPHAQSLDASGRVEVDGDAAGGGGVAPDHRLPITEDTVERRFVGGEDLALAEAVRFVRGEPYQLAPPAAAPAAPTAAGPAPTGR